MREPDRDSIVRRIMALPEDDLFVVDGLLQTLEARSRSVAASSASKAPLPTDVSVSDIDRLVARTAATPESSSSNQAKNAWPHAPVHRISEHGTYIVTTGTLYKQHLFRGSQRLDLLHDELHRQARAHDWELEAWAAFSNHYHFVGYSTENSAPLPEFLGEFHRVTALELNLLDNTPERSVWCNYWDTKLTFEKSYLARLNYVHQNPVKHGLVPVAHQYKWCSAAWFERTASRAQVNTIYSFKTDKLNVRDDFEPV